ncbi:MAG: hypothetical protein IT371_08320 [Deltaproteobacteria bacterium]|nr:hypothetical protein [Deltaproteobacteria bacterium]
MPRGALHALVLSATLALAACGEGAVPGGLSDAGATDASASEGHLDDGGPTPPAATSDAATLGPDAARPPSADGRVADGRVADSRAADSRVADSGATGLTPGAALLLGEANRQLQNLKSTVYQHTTSVNEATGHYGYDCSGFIDYSLKRVLMPAYSALPTASSVRPLAEDFVHHFNSLSASSTGPWSSVARPIELRPGDVVGWLTAPGSSSSNTGHVMIVRGTPTTNTKRPTEVLVPVVDATQSPHASDSRTGGQTGLGTGTIGIQVEASGRARAYYWRGGLSTTAVATTFGFGRPR